MKPVTYSKALYVSIVIIILGWLFKSIWSISRIDYFSELEQDPEGFFNVVTISGIMTLLVIFILLKLTRESFSDLDLTFKGFWRQLAFGVLFGIGIFFFHSFVLSPIFNSFLPNNSISLENFFTSKSYIPIWITLAIFKGGFQEEIWRVFVLNRFKKWKGRNGEIVALILSSIVFGLAHLYQGWDTVASTGVLGLFFGWLYLHFRKAWIPIIAHAVFDLIAISFAFSMYL